MIDYSKIKLIIWDLDDTFWKGTLSEGGCSAIDDNISIVKSSTDHGIINSICSKNDEDEALKELEAMGVDDQFVFRSINWQPKGERIQNTIKTMGLRPVNVLFIDDNEQNLNEAAHYSSGLMTVLPQDFLQGFKQWLCDTPANDINHKRLNQYKVLEEKESAKTDFSSNEEFLYSCNLTVTIHNDWENQINRIAELVNRSNQLNYTKVRSTKEELVKLCDKPEVDAGYVTVMDNFGDYGLVGFFAIDKIQNECIHFLFSCRTIGQGVEQYVYAKLGYPKLAVVGEVISYVDQSEAPQWINQEGKVVSCNHKETTNMKFKILFKGPCDLLGITNFLQGQCKIDEEFTYIGSKGNLIETHNHSVAIAGLKTYNEKEKQTLIDDCVFLDCDYWKSSLFEKKYDMVFLSTLMEPNIGLYQKRGTNLVIPFGEANFPLTEQENWRGYLLGKYYNAQNNLTKDFLESFSQKYQFVGQSDPEGYIKRLSFLMESLNPLTKVCLVLGSEMEYKNNKQESYNDRHIVHKLFNEKIREFAESQPNVLLLDVNDFIDSQNDFNGNINHFTVGVYYKMAERVKTMINDTAGSQLIQNKHKMALIKAFFVQKAKRLIRSLINENGRTFRIIKKLIKKT